MAGIIEGFESLHFALFTTAQHLSTTEVLLPLGVVIGVLVVACVIVALDGDRGQHVERIVGAFIPTFLVLPIFVFGVWFANGGDSVIGDVTGGMPDGNPLTVLVLILLQFARSVLYVLLLLLFPVYMLACALVIGYSVVRASPDLVMVVFLALKPVLRGLWAVLRLPFSGVREVFFWFTEPRSVTKIKREYKKKVISTQEAIDRARHTRETIVEEAQRRYKRKWWQPDFSIFSSTVHYNRLAEYIDSLARTQEAVSEHLKRTHRGSNDRRSRR